MADEQTSKSFNVKLHGSGVANCGSYPEIRANGTIHFSRAPGSSTVGWWVTGMSRSSCLPTSTTAKFGYPFKAYISVNGATPGESLIIKDNSTAANWTSSSVTKIYTPGTESAPKTFTSTADTVTVKFLVKGNTCMSGGNYCYRTSGYKTIATYTVDLPPYGVMYPVVYDGDGGSPVPETQQKSSLGPLTLSSTVPIKSVALNYHYDTTVVSSANRVFNNWKCSADSQTYAPGGQYSLDEECTMTAQWGAATFMPADLPDQYYRLTYVYNDGVGSPPYSDILRQELGYSDAVGSTTVYCVPGTSKSITDGSINSVDLYPLYGDATVVKNNLPVPTKSGFIFDGWYRDAQLTDKITANFDISGNTTIYAKWRELPIRQFTGGSWDSIDTFVWRFNAAENRWEKIAHILEFNGSEWVDTSQ